MRLLTLAYNVPRFAPEAGFVAFFGLTRIRKQLTRELFVAPDLGQHARPAGGEAGFVRLGPAFVDFHNVSGNLALRDAEHGGDLTLRDVVGVHLGDGDEVVFALELGSFVWHFYALDAPEKWGRLPI
jgi:hypothetical protein